MKLKSVICLGVFACLSIVGCSTKPKEHVHSYDKDNIEWRWTEQASGGYKAKAILSCLSCDESVEGHFLNIDAEVAEKQTKDPTCIAPGTITYTATINYEGQAYFSKREKAISDENAHHYVEAQEATYLKSAATCTEDAVYYKSCEHCHEKSEETFTVSNSKLGHNLEHHAATTSTCLVHGHIEYYECTRCHKLFSDENATTELSASDIELPYTHNMSYHSGVPATCTTDGTLGYYTCSYEPGVKYKDEAGEEKINDDSELVINKLGHTYNDSLECIRGDSTLKEEYEMEDATPLDEIAPITISDLGLTSGVEIPRDGSHIFTTYDYLANSGIDLWFRFNYTVSTGDGYFYFYLFNQYDEAGMVFRLQTNRTEDDGRIRAYIYTQNDYSGNPGTTAVHGAGSVGTNFWFPYPCGVKSSTINVGHITAYCLNANTNLYRCAITIGVEGGTQYYPVPFASDVPGSKGDNETTNPESHFDICLGANYFNDNLHRKFRATCSAPSNAVTLEDHASEESVVVYKNAAGNTVGKLRNPATTRIPTLVAENKTFLGWFDAKGNKINDGDTVSGKVIVTPRFVITKTNMFVPSDTADGKYAAAKGGWFDVESTNASGASSGQLPVSDISGGYDFYLIYHFVSKTSEDNYAHIDLPHDYIDAKTRISLRIDNHSNNALEGYVFGSDTNLGSAGAPGTNFSASGFRANGSDLLIHVAVSNASSAGLTYDVEIVNLGNGQTHTETRNVTFNDPTVYSLNDLNRNRFDCRKTNCEYQITDAF